MASILIGDGDPSSRGQLATWVHDLGHDVVTAADATEMLSALARQGFEVILADDRLPDMGGMALLREILQRQADVVVVLMSAHATVPEAVEAVRAGAYDYLAKPLSLQQVELLLEHVTEMQTLRRRNQNTPEPPPLLESANVEMARAITTARQVAASEATIVLTGESGTGKNVLAAAIHGWGIGRTGRFVAVSCPAFADHRLESDPFGHLKDAVTWAGTGNGERAKAAHRGTLFFDDVDELPLTLQAELLRFLEEHRFERIGGSQTIGARVIAATNRDLETEVRERRFRQDLFFRLNVVDIHLPPLRERPEDLPALTDHLLATLRARHHRERIQLAPEAREALAAYRWPGNVRELANVVERAVVLARADTIRAEDLPDRLRAPSAVPAAPRAGTALSLEQLERRHIEQVLADAATLEEAAARLGINATTLWRKRKRYRMG